MNFLAHLYLSGDFDELMVGNLMADFVKGKPLSNFSAQLIQGITLHREIDSFTDVHPIVRQSKQRLYPAYRHYASVIVDIFYDHFLAVNWHAYSIIPLPDFANHVYTLMNEKYNLLPESMQEMLIPMQSQNWLVSYAQLEGIERALQGMARRTKFNSNMEKASHDLQKDYALYQNEFNLYFPELIAYVSKVKSNGSF